MVLIIRTADISNLYIIYLGRKFYQLTAVNPGTSGYIVTKKGIDFLAKHIKSINDIEIDNLLFDLTETAIDIERINFS